MRNAQEAPDRPERGEGGDGGVGPPAWTEEQEAAAVTLFNDRFCFAELDGWTAHVVLNEIAQPQQYGDYPEVYIRIIFNDEVQRRAFLATRANFVIHPFEEDA